jgi:transposase-like protein
MKHSASEIIERLRADFGHELISERKKRIFSMELKRSLIQEAAANQVSENELALGLGISLSAVRNWKLQFGLGRCRGSKKRLFQKLEVEGESQYGEGQAAYLEGKSGVRIVGLSLNQMAEILRCL